MLRVIGGIYKSRRIKEVKSTNTRPTTDKNKESLFNMLGQYFQGGRMLDLFAGSGAIGIEALSRGIDEVDFIENNIQAVKTIQDNLLILGIKSGTKVYKQDVFTFLSNSLNKYDLIFADPPYALDQYEKILQLIFNGQFLKENGIIVLEAEKNQVFPERHENLVQIKEKILGNTKFAFYKTEENI